MADNNSERDQLIVELKKEANSAMSTNTRLEMQAWAILLEDLRDIKAALWQKQVDEGQAARKVNPNGE